LYERGKVYTVKHKSNLSIRKVIPEYPRRVGVTQNFFEMRPRKRCHGGGVNNIKIVATEGLSGLSAEAMVIPLFRFLSRSNFSRSICNSTSISTSRFLPI